MNKYFSALIGILGLGTGSCDNPSNHHINQMDTPNKPVIEQSLEDMITKNNDNQNRIHVDSKTYLMTAEPINAGITSEIKVFENFRKCKDDPIEKIIIYQDGEVIIEELSKGLMTEVSSTEAGEKTYTAKLITKSGIEFDTEPININFSGEPTDFKPFITDFLTSTTEAAKAARVIVGAKDIGDNRGIKEIRLYENDILIDTVNNSSTLVKLVEYDEPTSKTYLAEVEDLNGNIVKTRNLLEVKFTGEALDPKIFWNHVYEDAGRTTRIIFEASDKDNLDSNSGIVKAILYEDYVAIKEYNIEKPKEKFTILEDITRKSSGERIYHAEFFNGNGKQVVSKEFKVNFAGKDFQPEIEQTYVRYDPESDITSIYIKTNDKRNVRKDAKIETIKLFEGDCLIKFENNSDDLYLRMGGDKTKSKYHAIVTNTSGKFIQTEEFMVY